MCNLCSYVFNVSCSVEFETVSRNIAAKIESPALKINAAGAPNQFQIPPNKSDAGKTVTPNAKL